MCNKTKQTNSPPHRWLIRTVICLAVVAAFCLLLKYDVFLMRLRFWLIPERPSGLFKQILQGFRDFAQTVPMVVACIMVAIYDKPRRRKVITAVIIAQLISCIVYNAGKLTIVRYRPDAKVSQIEHLDHLTPAQTWVGFKLPNNDKNTQSFPSGHSGAAFALAVILACYYPPLRTLLWTLAIGCSLSRYLDLRHWPTDCLAGATIGYLAAWITLRLFKANPRP
ncbi:MAG: phosphatase PAP2 family protein [Planctomycetota bacterium]|jgi:membrane-associated phospholipid phosphatase